MWHKVGSILNGESGSAAIPGNGGQLSLFEIRVTRMQLLRARLIVGLAAWAGTLLAWAFSLGMRWGHWGDSISTPFWVAFQNTLDEKLPGDSGTKNMDGLRCCRTIREEELPTMSASTSRKKWLTMISRSRARGSQTIYSDRPGRSGEREHA